MPETLQDCWLFSDQSQESSEHASKSQNHKLITVFVSGFVSSLLMLQHNNNAFLVCKVFWVSQ